jgi:valyl-tRNA synthetase
MSKSLGNVIDPVHVINGVDLETLKDGVRTGNLASSEVER